MSPEPTAQRPNEGNRPHEQGRPVATARRRRLNLVSKKSIAPMVEGAVERALAPLSGELSSKSRILIRAALQREFMQAIREGGRRVSGMSKEDFLAELERSRNKIVLDRKRASEELQGLESELQKMRAGGREAASRAFKKRADAGSEDRAGEVAAEIRKLFAAAETEGTDLRELERKIVALSAKAMEGERERVLELQSDDHEKRIDLLERRISKLKGSLEKADLIIQRLHKIKAIDPGVASIYRDVQGLSDADDDFETKSELLTGIFQANMALQKAPELARKAS